MKNNFMREAIKEAETGITLRHGGPFGAVVVKEGSIIGVGHNMVVQSNDPTAHGEIMAIRNACKNIGSFDLSGADLYTTCYPCPMCLGAILWARIKNIYYCANSIDAAEIGFDDSLFFKQINNPEYIKKIMIYDKENAAACADLFTRYKDDVDKKLY